MVRERFLFRAGRAGYTYPELLEMRLGSVRILIPSEEARRHQRAVSTLIALAYVFIAGTILGALAVAFLSSLPAVALLAAVAVYILGLIGVLVWWDRSSLPLLAEGPAAAIPLELVGIQSFGTFQELRARANSVEVRVAVPGPRKRVEEAVRFMGSAANAR